MAWAYDYFVSRIEDPEKRKEFDEQLDNIRNFEQRRADAKAERLELVRRMQAEQQ